MPTFKTNQTKKTGTLTQANNNKNDYIFASLTKDDEGGRELHLLNGAKKKVVLDNQNLLIECNNGWTKLSVANVKEDETWTGWSAYFSAAKELKCTVTGYDDKNNKFVTAYNEEDGKLIIASGNEIYDMIDEDLTMAVIQRNTPGTSRFDVSFAIHSEHKIVNATFNKDDYDCVLSYLQDITEDIYDNGPDPYDWKKFLRVQKKDGGSVEDWRGVFAPLTESENEEADDDDDWQEPSDEESEVEEEEEEEEEFGLSESETDESGESEFELESDSEVSSDDMEGGEDYPSDDDFESPLKRRRV